LSAGRRRGFEEGYLLGGEEGVKLGRELGQIAGRLFKLLSQDPSENMARKITRTLQEILTVSFENREDLEKEVQISRIRGAYKELSTILNVSMPKSIVSEKAKFDF
jgi:flagellar biosynthesis/type III secretory pathway protein FliH